MNIYVDQELLTFCRELIELKLQQDKIDSNSNHAQSTKRSIQVNCNIQWPICHKTLKLYKTDLGEAEVWTFKQQTKPNLIKDYLQIKKKKSYKPMEDSRQKQKKILIGRVPHTCDVTKYNHRQSIEKENIELEDICISKKKNILNQLQSISEKLGIQNQHVKFFRRMAQDKLEFLRLSFINNAKNSQQQQQINEKDDQYDINHPSHFQEVSTINSETIISGDRKQQTKTFQTITQDILNKKTRNPFKKLKNKLNERKNKQKIQQQQ